MKAKSNHKVETASVDVLKERLEELRALYPDVFSEGKIDFEKLKAALGEEVEESPERYSFTWAGKRDAIRILQTPSRATLIPARDESLDFDTTQNIFIEGDNLESLKLLYKPYFGRVKMIYIDPPYNTGNDFVYHDKFSDPLDYYLILTGQKDNNGNLLTSNPESSGRYHSTWLSMMYPRLFLARQLLRDDGVIFVSIDDHEVHNLRMVMNELFGEENFLANICWERADSPKMDSEYFSTKHDYIVCYAKNVQGFKINRITYQGDKIPEHFNKVDDSGRKYYLKPLRAMGGQGETKESRPNLYYPITAPDGTIVYPKLQGGGGGAWRWSQKKFKQEAARIEWVKKGTEWTPYFRIYADDSSGKPPETMLFAKDVGSTRTATAELKSLFDAGKFFDTPKPTGLLKYLILISTSPDDIVLDFFAGSSSTAHAVLELNQQNSGNRKFILVQLPEPTGNDKYGSIAEVGKERIRRVISRIKTEGERRLKLEKSGDLGFKVFKLSISNFRQWRGEGLSDTQSYAKQIELLTDPLIEDWKEENVIYEVAIKEGFGLDISIKTSGVENISLVEDPDKGQNFYISLATSINLDSLRPLDLKLDDLFICRDTALDDETAANLALQCRLKTI